MVATSLLILVQVRHSNGVTGLECACVCTLHMNVWVCCMYAWVCGHLAPEVHVHIASPVKNPAGYFNI